ncbi:MAG: anaerobic ribonucleoside-triphosphate reductase activating protein [Chromatiales bacterium]|jgi:pyruvate formate lyase activating enzyme
MRIGGITPLTTIDYPGELAAVVFCQGCPWRCRYCQNGHLLPVRAGQDIPWSGVRAFLERRRGLLDAVVFSGGEPTAQGDLREHLGQVGALGFKRGLHTAGPSPARLDRALDRLEWVGLDIKALPEDYPALTGVPDSGRAAWKSLDIVLASGTDFEVRTTWMPGIAEADIRRLADRLVARGVGRFALQRAVTDRALDPGLRGSAAPAPSATLTAELSERFERFELR